MFEEACARLPKAPPLEGVDDVKLILALVTAMFLALAISPPASADQLARTVRAINPATDGDPHWPNGTQPAATDAVVSAAHEGSARQSADLPASPQRGASEIASVRPQHLWLLLWRIWWILG